MPSFKLEHKLCDFKVCKGFLKQPNFRFKFKFGFKLQWMNLGLNLEIVQCTVMPNVPRFKDDHRSKLQYHEGCVPNQECSLKKQFITIRKA